MSWVFQGSGTGPGDKQTAGGDSKVRLVDGGLHVIELGLYHPRSWAHSFPRLVENAWYVALDDQNT